MPAFTGIGRSLVGSSDPAVAQAARAAAFAGGVRDALAPLGADGKPTYVPAAAYPQTADAFPKRLAGFAAMLAAGLPIRAAAVRAPGAWDTHANQEDVLPKNLQLTFDSLLAFQRDLEARGLADRVLTLVWSEFGRRAAENGSGTDHGAAGVGFLIGTRASGRMIGEFPGLEKLDADGNLRATSDFRGVYGALCGDWFGVDPAVRAAGRARHRQAGGPEVKAFAARRGAAGVRAGAVAPARRGDRVPLHALAHDGQARAGDRPARDPRRGPARSEGAARRRRVAWRRCPRRCPAASPSGAGSSSAGATSSTARSPDTRKPGCARCSP